MTDARLRRSVRAGSGAAIALLVFASFYTLYFARVFFIPVVLALVMALTLAPVVRFLSRLGIPRAIAGGLVCLALLGSAGGMVQVLATPVADLLNDAPSTLRKLRHKLGRLRQPIEKVSEMTAPVAEITNPAGSIRIETSSFQEDFLDNAGRLIVAALITLTLVFFMLGWGRDHLQRLVAQVPGVEDKRKIVAIAQGLGNQVSRYLATITLINVGLGVAVGFAMHLAGMNNAVLLGAMATSFNFIPYVGAIAGATIIAALSIVGFDSWTAAMVPPLLFVGLTTVESYLVTPSVLGRSLMLARLPLLLGVLFWGWIWGIPGAFVAVPIMAGIKIVCDRYDGTRWLGGLLGSEPLSSTSGVAITSVPLGNFSHGEKSDSFAPEKAAATSSDGVAQL